MLKRDVGDRGPGGSPIRLPVLDSLVQGLLDGSSGFLRIGNAREKMLWGERSPFLAEVVSTVEISECQRNKPAAKRGL